MAAAGRFFACKKRAFSTGGLAPLEKKQTRSCRTVPVSRRLGELKSLASPSLVQPTSLARGGKSPVALRALASLRSVDFGRLEFFI
ncbi:MAG: hypothetical protein COB08_010610 [Rhodobacteraceae bacterium]|nr:hypothetical protein [Paracoccaceae bacterium]